MFLIYKLKFGKKNVHVCTLVHLNVRQRVFLAILLFDRLETGIKTKISKSLIAHYCTVASMRF